MHVILIRCRQLLLRCGKLHIKGPAFFFVFFFLSLLSRFFTYSAFQRAQTEYVYKKVCFFSKGAGGSWGGGGARFASGAVLVFQFQCVCFRALIL